MCRALLDTMKCEAPREDDIFIEMILYALVSISTSSNSSVHDPVGLQATLLAVLRDVLLESGTQPPPALDRLVFRSQRIHQRRQRRRQREALQRQLQHSEGDHTVESPTVSTASPDPLPESVSGETDIPDHADGFQTVHTHTSYGATALPLQNPRHPQQQPEDASQHLSRLMAVTEGLDISQLTSQHRPRHHHQRDQDEALGCRSDSLRSSDLVALRKPAATLGSTVGTKSE
ncbi:uncharacterized protein [Panulirus ornatus]|uniref:uncharacterized protein isoform X2 n=1 Tax=Panulirus ornatus TaxID=150431 RepID=UPI003A84FC02